MSKMASVCGENAPDVVSSRRVRLPEIDVAAGIAIILVVIGHMEFLATGGIGWYGIVRSSIYGFHMQVFFFLVGFLFFHTKDVDNRDYQHWRFLGSKVVKFLKPFTFFALFFYGIDFFLAADKAHYISHWRADFYRQLFVPAKASPAFLWFVYVLLMLYATVPLAARLFSRRWRAVLLLPAFALHISVTTLFLSLNFYARHLPFFLCGMLYCYHKDAVDRLVRKWGWVSCVLMVGWLIAVISTDWRAPAALAVIAIPVVLMAANRLAGSAVLQAAGRNSFAIYLQNMTIIGGMYLGLSRGLKLGPEELQYFIPLFVVAAVGIPLLMERVLPRRWRLVRDVLGYP